MKAERYLCFNLGTEEFGVPLLSVKEVLAMPEVVSIPFAPNHFLGIMNLRGQVISIIDLRSKFGFKVSMNPETSVIICDMESVTLGVVVDSINSVLNPLEEELKPKPEIQGTNTAEHITSIYKKDDRIVLFLNIAKTLNVTDKKHLAKAA
jgi:purine-binding chemotaxis protein CheW